MHIVPALTGFTSRYPDLSLDLRLSDSILDMVEGGFDIAIRNSSLNDSTLVARKLAADDRMVFASPSFLAKHGEPSSIAEISDFDCVGLMGLDDWAFACNDW